MFTMMAMMTKIALILLLLGLLFAGYLVVKKVVTGERSGTVIHYKFFSFQIC